MRGRSAGAGAWILVAVGVAGVSLSAPIAAATAAPAIAIGFWRNAFGAAAMLPVAVVRRPRRRAPFRGLPRPAVAASVLAGVLLAVHFGTWLTSLRMTSVTAATALVCTTPIWIVAWELLRGVRVPRAVLVGTVVAIAGGVAITGVDAAASGRALAGDGLALLGAVAAGGYMAAGERARAKATTAEYTTLAYGTCALALVPVALITGSELWGYEARTWIELVVLTAVAQIFGHSALNAALPRVGATAVALALLLETPGATLVAWVWPGQTPSFWVIPGTVLMLVGLAIVVRAGGGRSPSPEGVVEVT